MKAIIAILSIVLLTLAGCVSQAPVAEPVVRQPFPASIEVEPEPEPVVIEPVVIEPEVVEEESSGVKEIHVEAKQWEFIPSTIRVNQGDEVKLIITSIDITHGVSIPTFGVAKRLKPGTDTIIEFTADRTGEFPFYCDVFCGNGHRGMKGTLIVE